MERVMAELASYFSGRGDLQVHLLLYGITREIFYHVSGDIELHLPPFRFNNKFRIFSALRTMFYLRSEIKKIDPETILSFGEYWNSFVLISLVLLPYPVFISDRCQPDMSLGRIHDWLRKKTYPRAKGIIVQTRKAEEIYRAQYKKQKIKVIGNPIRIIPKRNELKKESIVLTVGRLIESKHHDELIKMFIRISKPDWKLVVVGYDHLKQNVSEKLRQIIKENHAEEIVCLDGKQTDVESYYLKSQIFAFTSSSEGFPNVIGEAMAAGLPVVAFDCIAGPSEMIEDNKNGLLVALYDYKTFQNKLELLMDNDDIRIRFGEQARSDIRQFSIKNIGDEYIYFLFN
jgi:GalNAc-alpha-(1->4)-GalNAc-alpha-(1->3)-diNAcBac-PP-undecaprenol alpha-1,4-N-acetyl-D-galactosaminyltransferase